MVTVPSANKRYPLQQTGDNVGTWGVVLNQELIQVIDLNLSGRLTVDVSSGNVALTEAQARNLKLRITGSPAANRTVTLPNFGGFFIVENAVSNTASVNVVIDGGTGTTLPAGKKTIVFSDPDQSTADPATNYFPDLSTGSFTATDLTAVDTLRVGVPSNYWTPSSAIFHDQDLGYFGTNGSFALGLYWNGYRNAGNTWTSLGANGSTAGGKVEINFDGVRIGFDGTVSGIGPSDRLVITGSAITAVNAAFTGNGSGLTNLPAANLTGTVPDAALTGSYTGLTSLTGSGNASFARLFASTGGTADAPTISFSGDSNTGFRNTANGQGIHVSTDGTDRARIYSAGIQVLNGHFIGDLNGNANTATTAATAANATTATNCGRSVVAGDGLSGGGQLTSNVSLAVDGSVVRTSRSLSAGTGLTGGGNLGSNLSFAVDNTVWRNGNTPSATQVSSVLASAHIGGGWIFNNNNVLMYVRRDNGVVIQFGAANGAAYGNISNAPSSTTYNATSDYRLKTEIEDLSESGIFIDALRPRRFKWVRDGMKQAGFISHEFAEVSPTSVTGKKDEIDDDGKPVYQTMQAGTSEVIAHIVAELQSLRRRVGNLELGGKLG